MKISIITPSFNSAKTIEDTVISVISQTFKNIEYIIIDGGSKDGTLEILEKYKNQISKVISEPDKGIYDAMNKGIALATGDVIGILNSDDFYFDNSVLEKVADKFNDPAIEACYGDLIFVDSADKAAVKRFWKSGNYQEQKLNYGWSPPHPTFFVKKEVYEKYGKFRLDLSIAADYELMLRIIKVHKIKIAYIPEKIACMRIGGTSSKNISNRIKSLMQARMAWKMNGLKVPFLVNLKPLFKISQFLKKN